MSADLRPEDSDAQRVGVCPRLSASRGEEDCAWAGPSPQHRDAFLFSWAPYWAQFPGAHPRVVGVRPRQSMGAWSHVSLPPAVHGEAVTAGVPPPEDAELLREDGAPAA